MPTDAADMLLFGVNLHHTIREASTNLGVCIVSAHVNNNLTVSQVRECIQSQLASCPSKFVICTKEGWRINIPQEDRLVLSQIITEDGCVNIKIDHENPKIGVKDKKGAVIGFVFVSHNADLQTLKTQIVQEILHPQDIAETFQLLDNNHWPISTVQESHMTVSEILIGSCVHTTILYTANNITHSISPTGPPLKKLKRVKELSFNSSKDICWQPGTKSSHAASHAKQILISYVSVESAGNALKIKEELVSLGFSVYLDVHEIQSGLDWQDSLNFAVSECEVFIPLVTRKYGETLWTNREVKLADVLGKYILPINFLEEWPPRCLAIQFATTQFIPWKLQQDNQDRSAGETKPNWHSDDVKRVTLKIAERIQQLSISSTPSLVKRATIVKSCPCVSENNQLAITTDREGKPLIMICVHPDQESYALELKTMLEKEPFEVWCTTALDKDHLAYLDGLTSSQEGESYLSVITKKCDGNEYLHSIQTFQEKADDASVVLFVLSKSFSMSRTCQQQAFYCEHRKRVIPLLCEEFQIPDWMTMLFGSSRFESTKDEHFENILIQRIKVLTGSSYGLKKELSNQSESQRYFKRKLSTNYDYVDSSTRMSSENGDTTPLMLSPRSSETSPLVVSPMNAERSPVMKESPKNADTSPVMKRPSLTAMKTVLL